MSGSRTSVGTGRSIVPILAFLAVLGASLLIRPRGGTAGAEIRTEIERLEKARPALLCIGNSYLAAAVNPAELSRLTGATVQMLYRGGAQSACYYLFLKNVVAAAAHRPKAVLIYFQDHFLTVPTFRIDGNNRATKILPFSNPSEPLIEELAYKRKRGPLLYGLERLWPAFRHREEVRTSVTRWAQAALLSAFPGQRSRKPGGVLDGVFSSARLDPELQGERQLAEESLPGMPRDALDFRKWIDRSFLPHIVRTARESGTRLILVRMKRRAQAMGVAQTPALKAYIKDLKACLEREGVPFIDFSNDPRLSLEHFRVGDHLAGWRVFTPMLAEALAPLL